MRWPATSSLILLAAAVLPAQPSADLAREAVRRTRGFVALWDFAERGGTRLKPLQASREKANLQLEAVNYVREFWHEGREATWDDFAFTPAGPFGGAVRFNDETDPTFRPVLLVPRHRLHGSGIDVKGPGQSVTLLAWIQRDKGDHAIAGIWHEGTDLAANSKPAARIEPGMRQYALFAGLAANPGASAAHVSENGGSSFGDKYARYLSVTPEKIPPGWSMVGLRFDNRANTVTSSLNGVETEYWIDNPTRHRFFQWAAKGWQEGAYRPPPGFVKVVDGKLAALKVNPFWFPHDLYTPPSLERGGPFTIGRVIHSSRSVGFVGQIGGVAVFNRSLSPKQLKRLAALTLP